jgi:hypothetical protein
MDPATFVRAVDATYAEDFTTPSLIIARHGQHLFFAIDHDNGRYHTLVGYHDGTGEALSAALGGAVVEVYGNSTTDDVGLYQHDRGRERAFRDTYVGEWPRTWKGVDVAELFEWGDLSLNGSSPHGLRVPLPIASPSLELEELFMAVNPDLEARRAFADRVVSSGLPWQTVVDRLARLELSERAVDVALSQPQVTRRDRNAITTRLLRIRRPDVVAPWADDDEALDGETRRQLLLALGRDEDARRLHFQLDLENLDATLDALTLVYHRKRPLRPEPRGVPASDGPIAGILREANAAEIDLLHYRPLDEDLLARLADSGVPALVQRAKALEALRTDLDERRVEHLGVLLTQDPDARRRGWLQQLALARAASGAPDRKELMEALRLAWPSDPVKKELEAVLATLGGPEEHTQSSAAPLPEPTPEAIAALRQLQALNDGSKAHRARVALAMLAAGDPGAQAALEDAYIALSHSHPMRAPTEDALRHLGLL